MTITFGSEEAALIVQADRQCEGRIPLKLTPRQTQVLKLAARGLASPEMAQVLGIAKQTVRHHLIGAYARLGVHDRAGAVVEAIRQGIVDPDEDFLVEQSSKPRSDKGRVARLQAAVDEAQARADVEMRPFYVVSISGYAGGVPEVVSADAFTRSSRVYKEQSVIERVVWPEADR